MEPLIAPIDGISNRTVRLKEKTLMAIDRKYYHAIGKNRKTAV